MSKHTIDNDNHRGKKQAQHASTTMETQTGSPEQQKAAGSSQETQEEGGAASTEQTSVEQGTQTDARTSQTGNGQEQQTEGKILKEELEAKIASLEAEVSELKDQYLRKAAEFENFRKRMQREKQEAIEYANQSLLLDIIPIIDDFERAIKSSEAAKNYDSLHEGISMIEKRLVSQLETKWGLVRYESAGQPFDPTQHEAIMMEQSESVQEPMVGEDLIKGYRLKDRIIRTAKVKVLMPSEPKQTDPGENPDTLKTN
ncbi:MAG: nucleotide exchange factor GrpE [Termitinemataceae bacterium]